VVPPLFPVKGVAAQLTLEVISQVPTAPPLIVTTHVSPAVPFSVAVVLLVIVPITLIEIGLRTAT
jgi:hypothetical protein